MGRCVCVFVCESLLVRIPVLAAVTLLIVPLLNLHNLIVLKL